MGRELCGMHTFRTTMFKVEEKKDGLRINWLRAREAERAKKQHGRAAPPNPFPRLATHLHDTHAVLLAAARYEVTERLRGRQRSVAVCEQRLAAQRGVAVEQWPEPAL